MSKAEEWLLCVMSVRRWLLACVVLLLLGGAGGYLLGHRSVNVNLSMNGGPSFPIPSPEQLDKAGSDIHAENLRLQAKYKADHAAATMAGQK